MRGQRLQKQAITIVATTLTLRRRNQMGKNREEKEQETEEEDFMRPKRNHPKPFEKKRRFVRSRFSLAKANPNWLTRPRNCTASTRHVHDLLSVSVEKHGVGHESSGQVVPITVPDVGRGSGTRVCARTPRGVDEEVNCLPVCHSHAYVLVVDDDKRPTASFGIRPCVCERGEN